MQCGEQFVVILNGTQLTECGCDALARTNEDNDARLAFGQCKRHHDVSRSWFGAGGGHGARGNYTVFNDEIEALRFASACTVRGNKRASDRHLSIIKRCHRVVQPAERLPKGLSGRGTDDGVVRVKPVRRFALRVAYVHDVNHPAIHNGGQCPGEYGEGDQRGQGILHRYSSGEGTSLHATMRSYRLNIASGMQLISERGCARGIAPGMSA